VDWRLNRRPDRHAAPPPDPHPPPRADLPAEPRGDTGTGPFADLAAEPSADVRAERHGARHPDWVEPIARRPAWVAAVAVAALALIAWRTGPGAELPAYLYLGAVGVPLAFIDVGLRRLPDALTLPSYAAGGALLGIAAAVTPHGGVRYLHALVGLAALLVCYAVQWFFMPGHIGLGDVKLAGVLGLYLGWLGLDGVLLGVFVSHLLGGLYAAALLATRRADRKATIPFGPFMLAGTLVAILVHA
jgi:leader peptidase (prepilin peptidase)/N-methyltransferase